MAGHYEFTRKRQARFCIDLSEGLGRYAAAGNAGINPRTYQRLMLEDESFRDAVYEAEQLATDAVVSNLWRLASKGDNPAAAFGWLYNKRPEEWTDKRALAVTGADDGPIQFQVNIGEIPDYESMLDDDDPRAWMVGNGHIAELPAGENGNNQD